MKKQLIIAFATMLAAALATPAHALWNVTVQQEGASPGGNIVGGTVDNIGEAETLLAGGGPAEGTDSPLTINYSTAFPGVAAGGGDPPNDFALEANGYVTGLSGPTSFTLYVNSDDGFRVRINGVVPASSGGSGDPAGSFEFDNPTGGSNTTSVPVLLNNNDFIRLTYFERGGGNNVTFRINNGSGALVGDPASGILISQVLVTVPEPSTLLLIGLGLGSLMVFGRRIRHKASGIVAGLLALSLIGSAQAVLTLQYDTWTQSNPVINTGTTGTLGTQVTPGSATIVAGPPNDGGFALHLTATGSGNDYINANLNTGPGGVDIQGHSFTVGAWVNIDTSTGTGGDHMVFGTSWGGTGNDGLHIGFRDGAAHFGTFGNDTTGGSVTAGEWNYWIWRYDSTLNGGEQDIFKDGVLVVAGTPRGPFTGDLPLHIGAGIGAGGNLGGSLDDVRIYNTALSNTEVAALNLEVRVGDLPEPSTFMLMGLGLVGLYAGFKRTKK